MTQDVRHVLGFDGGGTRCDAVLMDERGAIAGWGRGGPTVEWYTSEEEVARAVRRAVSEALASTPVPIVAAVSTSPGLGAASRALEECAQPRMLRTVDEGRIAMAVHQVDSGVVVLSGTGSGVYARNDRGDGVHLGGAGPVIGDEGSAYDIGRRALRACLRAHQSPRSATTLRERILSHTGVSEPGQIVDWVYLRGASRCDIAALARLTDEEAEAGDAVARRIIIECATELAELALEAMDLLGMTTSPCALLPSGSVASRSRLYWSTVAGHIRRQAPLVEERSPGLPPAVGGALLALRDSGVEWTAELLEQVEASARGWERLENGMAPS